MDWAHGIMLINASFVMPIRSWVGPVGSLFQTPETLFRSLLRIRNFG
jgi:hypothetical protein